MNEIFENPCVIGVDFGTDSCRALLVDTVTGEEITSSVCYYPRWAQALYCNPNEDKYRQHPLDYIETFESAIKSVVAAVGDRNASMIRGISFDTTASTPVLVDSDGMPLALTEGLENEPDAMFVLWKDHTSKKEAVEINELSKQYTVDYTLYCGGTYSAEWVWAKMLHLLRTNARVCDRAYCWIEHCDWMSAWLTDNLQPETVFRSRCAAGHKAMWRAEWGGLPSAEFLASLHPKLAEFGQRMRKDTSTADVCAGVILPNIARRLGLPQGIAVGVGSIDAHVGAVGACIEPYVLTRIIGTSTCDILVSPKEIVRDAPICGICGQVDGSVIKDLIGFEAGQSAFGDLYAWFKNLLLWAPTNLIQNYDYQVIEDAVLPRLCEDAAQISASKSSVLALDWMNGRRTPDANQYLRGALCGLTLGTTAPMIFRALVEATAYGSKAIISRFREEGVRIDKIIAIGGIAQKSPFVMQVLCDVIGMTIGVVKTNQACALGAAMFASVAAGLHTDITQAQQAMGSGLGCSYKPNKKRHIEYLKLYDNYVQFGEFVETAHL